MINYRHLGLQFIDDCDKISARSYAVIQSIPLSSKLYLAGYYLYQCSARVLLNIPARAKKMPIDDISNFCKRNSTALVSPMHFM